MNNRARIAFTHIIAATLVIILILSVLGFGSPLFNIIKEKMGFTIDLNPQELETQKEAKLFFNDVFVNGIQDCERSSNVSCFCFSEDLIFPSGYSLKVIAEGGIKYELYNHNGGMVVDNNLKNVYPCLGWTNERNLHYFDIVKDSNIKLIYGQETSLSFIDIETDVEREINELLNLSYIFYKPNQDAICVLSASYSGDISQKKICK